MNRPDATDAARPDPWYRHRWPWLLIAGPALTIAGCIVTIVLALEHADPVVARPSDGGTAGHPAAVTASRR